MERQYTGVCFPFLFLAPGLPLPAQVKIIKKGLYVPAVQLNGTGLSPRFARVLCFLFTRLSCGAVTVADFCPCPLQPVMSLINEKKNEI